MTLARMDRETLDQIDADYRAAFDSAHRTMQEHQQLAQREMKVPTQPAMFVADPSAGAGTLCEDWNGIEADIRWMMKMAKWIPFGGIAAKLARVKAYLAITNKYFKPLVCGGSDMNPGKKSDQ